jgi:HicA toxin of bacterial toxin-antitoxin,
MAKRRPGGGGEQPEPAPRRPVGDLNSRHLGTLNAIFTDPVPANILWTAVMGLFGALGADVRPGKGSRVRVSLNDRAATFHRPHPEKETDRGAVMSVRRFLVNAGVEP